MSDFISDEDMDKMEQESAPAESPDFISDEEMDAKGSGIDLGTAGSMVTSGAVTGGVTELARRGLGSDTVKGWAEDLAFKGMGGQGTRTGADLVVETAKATPGKNFGVKELPKSVLDFVSGNTNTSKFDQGVSPRNTGREILDQKLLGPLGLGTTEGNLSRTNTNLMKSVKPTNELLERVGQDNSINKDDIFRSTKEKVGYDTLNETVPDQATIKKKLDKLNDSDAFSGFESPLEAEQAKRELQRSVDFGEKSRSAKEAVNKAQSVARREAVEESVKNKGGEALLEEFKALKMRTGNAGIAKDMAEETVNKMDARGIQNTVSSFLGDLALKKFPAMAGTALDGANKVAKSGFGKALPVVAGGLAGAGITLAEEAFDSETEGSGNEQAQQQREAEEFNRRDKALQSAKPDQRDALQKMYGNIDKPDFSSVRHLEHTPEEIQALAEKLQAEGPGGQSFIGPLTSAANANERKRTAIMYGLQQQPAFRNLYKKYKN